MFMALYPEVQRKCQDEIDDILGQKHPAIDDMSRMTYIMATLMEIQRYSIVAQGTLLHSAMRDTEANGYYFKKGTIFIANIQKFLRDPKEFPEPESFNPERFICEDGKIKKIEYFVPFGIGKRICMGESLAKNEMFIFFVRFFQRMNVSCIDNQKPDPTQFTSGVTRIPKPFIVSVDLRA